MTLEEFAQHFESEMRQHVAAVCQQAAQSIRQSTPSDRIKTRRAVRVFIRGTRGRVALNFRTRYPTQGTQTLRRLESQWKALRPRVRAALIKRINQTLKG